VAGGEREGGVLGSTNHAKSSGAYPACVSRRAPYASCVGRGNKSCRRGAAAWGSGVAGQLATLRALARTRCVAACLLLALVWPLGVPATAQTIDQEGDRVPGLPEPSIAVNFPRDFGDPGGIRSALAGRGVTYAVNYIGEVLGNPTGGFAQGAFYDGRLELALTVDLAKAIGWDGLSFFTNAYQIHGRSISAEDLGVLMPVSFIEALPSTRLFELWLEQKLLDDRLSFRFGQLAADSEFMISEGAGAFLNATWGWPSIAGINLPDGGPAYPLASPGARLAFNPNDTLGFLIGVYSGDPAGNCGDLPQECNPDGLSFHIHDPLLMIEAAIKYNQGEGELPGTLKIGAWREFGSFEQGSTGTGGLPIGLQPVPGEVADHNRAFYVILDQMLYRLPGKGDPKGIAFVGRAMTAPSDGNMIELYWEAGLTFEGLWSARPDDILGIGFAYTGVSSQIIEYDRSQGFPVIPSFEGMLEVSYTAELMQGLTLQPTFQYFWNPGGHAASPDDPYTAVPNAAVLGLRSAVNY
jgi:porin